MKNIFTFLIELRLNNGATWVENDILKFSIPKKFQNEETKKLIQQNKSLLIDTLTENRVFSKAIFYDKKILRRTTKQQSILSFSQQRLWFIESFEGGTNAYHMPMILELSDATDKSLFEKAIQSVIRRHKVLRSVIKQGQNYEWQQLVKDDPLVFSHHRSNHPEYKTKVQTDINLPFNLGTEYPIRVSFYDVLEKEKIVNRYALILMHHIASDGWSLEIFARELDSYYRAYASGNSNYELPELPIQYSDYALWERSTLVGDTLSSKLLYWQKRLSGYETLSLPTDYVRPSQLNYKGDNVQFTIPEPLSIKLRNLSQNEGVTLHNVLLSSIAIVLGKYCNQEDILIGSPYANRDHHQTSGLIGFFINALVNRVLLNKEHAFIDLIHQVHKDQVEAQKHQDLPFEKLLDHLSIERDLSRHPLFQVMFAVQSFGQKEVVTLSDFVKPVNLQDGDSIEKFDLSIFMDDRNTAINVQISYATSLFKAETINRLATQYLVLLENVITNSTAPYLSHSLLDASGYQTVVYDWNATEVNYPEEETIISLFESQVQQTPNQIALVYEDQELSYYELNEKSNQLALEIRNQYKNNTGKLLKPDTLIAVCLERSLEMVLGILGVLKAGAAYVPIDIEYPKERLDYMLEDTATSLVLTQKNIAKNQLSHLKVEQLLCIDLNQTFYKNNPTDNIAITIRPKDLSYVIYTSGTTGTPKGVMIEHKNLNHLVNMHGSYFSIRSGQSVLQYSPYVFDVSVTEIFVALSVGATLHIVNSSTRHNVQQLLVYIKKFDIQHAHLPPAILKTLSEDGSNIALPTLVIGGEPCALELMEDWSINRRLINAYGPTEATVCATMNDFNKGDIATNIGKPNSNTKTYVLDRFLNPVPVGVVGELYLGGAGIARGYLNQKELTKKRFVKNPFATNEDESKGYTSIYKTGDLVRWLTDGNLEYIGRNDDQVKIRGYRIELEEIERALLSIAGISQSCVLVKEKHTDHELSKHLVGYYVPSESEKNIEKEALIEALSKVLPEYMIPNIFVGMAEFPMTINGKLNKKALPDPEYSRSENYIAPETAMEKALSKIWAEVLGLEKIGITDHFFRVGGNSILAMQLVHKINEQQSLGIKVSDIFKYPTVKQVLEHTSKNVSIAIPKRSERISTLSFSQQRLWFIESYESGTNAYHMPLVLELLELTDGLLLEKAIQSIIQRHEVLRSVMTQSADKQWQQVVHDSPLVIKHHRCNSKEYTSQIQSDSDRSFNLETEYPIRVCFYEVTEVEQVINRYVLILMHHIASDGWSMEVFARELNSYYKAYLSEIDDFELPVLPIQYSDYAVWERNNLTGVLLADKLTYWKTLLSGYETLALPTDYARPAQLDYKGNTLNFVIPERLSVQIRALTKNEGVTLNSVLLSTIAVLLGKYSNQKDILIGSPHVNRNHYQTNGLIGFFVNTIVNRISLEQEQSFLSLINQVHQDQVNAQKHQDFPFEQLLDHLSIERDLSRHPLFQVMFSLQSFGHKEAGVLSEYVKPVSLEDGYQIEKFDLSIFMDDSSTEIGVQISYATSLFKTETIQRLSRYYLVLLDKLFAYSATSYLSHSLLDTSNYQTMVYDWNATTVEYPKEKTLIGLFEAQVEQTPNEIALIYKDQELSFTELNEKSNQLAIEIRKEYSNRTEKTLQADTLIALCLERSLEMVIGILGVLKAGAAYVPIDPEYPKERIDFILEDTESVVLLTQKHIAQNQLVHLSKDKMLLVDLNTGIYQNEEKENLGIPIDYNSLFIAIYTSGTTGKPKGVLIEHHTIHNTIDDWLPMYALISNATAHASYVFDASIWEIFSSLLSGSRLHILPDAVRLNTEILSAYLVDHAIDVCYIPPVLLKNLPVIDYPNLSYLLYAGEPCDAVTAQKWSSKVVLWNYYGPTEASICVSKQILSSEVHLIGKPIQNTTAYVLDNFNQPVPIGVIGELYIGGAGVARGYLNRKELTNERFIKNPFATDMDKAVGYTNMYKTGDVVRWLPDGNLEFFGRNDDQVKIRGYRIELSEIEYTLSNLDGISQSCVLVKERTTDTGTSKYLVGYYIVSDQTKHLNPEDLIRSLSEALPEYMIPSTFVAMEAFPMTVNGKLDKRALPDPEFRNEAHYVAPETDLEKALSTIWANILGLEKVGIADHFFRIGGNSILAMQLTHKINEQLSVGVKVSDLFKYPTIKLLLEFTSKETSIEIPKRSERISPLSFSQQRLWFIESYEDGTNAYHMPLVLELLDATDAKLLEKAIQSVIRRHEVLRSVIAKGVDNQWQQVLREMSLPINHYRCNCSEYKSQIQSEIDRPFNLEAEYPIRVSFYDVIEEDQVINHYVLILMHHIASDGWSLEVFARELDSYYKAYLSGDSDFELPALPIQYSDYATWERNTLSGTLLEDKLVYWEDRLSGYETLSLPTDYRRPTQLDYKGKSFAFAIPEHLSVKLRELAQSQGVTLNSVLLSTIAILLGKYSNQEDILIGSPHANRDHYQTGGLIGFFINTLVNRVLLDKEQSFLDLIKKVHQDQVNAQVHQDFPFEQLLDHLSIERDLSRHALFQVMFTVQSFGRQEAITLSEYLKHVNLEEGYQIEKFDLSIFMNDSNTEIGVDISYATSLFKAETINRLSQHYLVLLDHLVKESTTPYLAHSLLDTSNYQKLVYDWNAKEANYPKEETIISLFESQVKKTPHQIALVFEDQELSYKALNEKSNQLAVEIRKQYENRTGATLKPDTLIALCLERSLELVIGILGVLKAGGAYVPIDSGYPKDRIDFMLQDTGAALVLTQEHIAQHQLVSLNQNQVLLINLNLDFYKKNAVKNLAINIQPKDLSYVIYTSGTTGKPKGVMQPHGNVIRLFSTSDTNFNFSSKDIWTMFHSYVFDFSVWELWGALLYGGKLILPSTHEVKDVSKFYDLCQKYKVSVLNQTPSAFYQVLDIMLNRNPAYFRYIIFGGEALNLNHITSWWDYKDKNGLDTVLVNMYGITETTVHVTYKELQMEEEVLSNIGKPLPDLKAYVLDKFRNPLPLGVIGELYIGGAGVARGYLNRKTLTKERFIENPFATDLDRRNGYTRMYKTGDLVRWLADGNLEYMGRNDDQVKIHGYRIELAEIETALASIDGISESCVLVKERTTNKSITKYLVGYYIVSEAGIALSSEDLVGLLSEALPEYMIPSAFIAMKAFPITVNGKLDKRALPDPEFTSETHYVAPETELEKTLCIIWASVLGLEQIGITDHFFRIGGNSILAMQLVHQINEQQSIGIKVSDLFKYPTIKQVLEQSAKEVSIEIPKHSKRVSPLSFSQQRLWFIESYESGTNAYHMPVVLELLDATDRLLFEQAIQSVIKRHEILRSVIARGSNNQWQQVVQKAPLKISYNTCDRLEYALQLQSDTNRPFSLETEYPIRVCFYEVLEEGHVINRYILILMHHIASDGWSMEVFSKELSEYYNAYQSGMSDFELPALPIQYSDYAMWEQNMLSGSAFSDKLSYWESLLSGYQTLSLPTDYTRPAQLDYKGDSFLFTIPEYLSASLRNLTQSQGVTLHSALLSTVAILLGKYGNQENILIGSPHANRNHYQTGDLIGFFINTIVNRVVLNKAQSFIDLIHQVHHDQVSAQKHQDFPFEQLLEHLDIERDLSRHPLFQVMFAVQSFRHKEAGALSKYVKPVSLEAGYQVEKFDLSIFMDDSNTEIGVKISYATSLFKTETIERLAKQYLVLLESLVTEHSTPYLANSLLDAQSFQTVVYDWNAAEIEYPTEETIVSLFESQVKQTPYHTALVYEDKELSYQELNDRTNQLAQEIRKQYKNRTGMPLKPDTLITLCLDQSLEMLIGILGVLKAGGAYVPMDPKYPQDRIFFILEDTASVFVLTQENIAKNQLAYIPEEQLLLIDLKVSFYKSNATENLAIGIQPKNLSYVIYTSGTTGKPKGVMIEHKDAIQYLFTFNNLTGDNHKKISSIQNYCFDASMPTLLLGVIDGITTYILNADLLHENKLKKYIIKNKIDTIRLTPSMLDLIDLTDIDQKLTVILGGEKMSFQPVNKLISNKNLSLYNHYGPTECTVGSTVYKLNKKIENQIIGAPFPSTRTYVLDLFKKPVPVGVIGELYIGGVGVARGYLNRKELTEERFVNNPFAKDSDIKKGYTRMYKTGDLVRWLPNGNLEYIGRNDDQVKIRGYRIELEEIEVALSGIEGISQACVVTKEHASNKNSSKYLVGYYLPTKANTEIASEVLIGALAKLLPEYMIPSAFIAIAKLPMTPNGKLNKRALPDPDFRNEQHYVAPKTDLEKTLCATWANILGIEKVGVTDHFFRIGGNSILAMQLAHQINEQKSIGIKVSDLFKYPTIKKLLEHATAETTIEITKRSERISPLSFSQQRLWFIESYEGGTNAYHMPLVLELLEDTVPTLLEQAIQSVIKRHEVLRSIMKRGTNNQWHQVVQEAPLSISHYRCDRYEYDSKVQSDMNRPFNLEIDYPIRVCFYEVLDKEGQPNRYALILMHHIASDGWSMQVFSKELDSYYEAYQTGVTDFELSPLPIQYNDYAVWERNALTDDVLSNKLMYWKNRLSGHENLSLPTDYVRPAKLDYHGNSFQFLIPEHLSIQLRNVTQSKGVTLYSVLLASVAILLGKYSNQQDLLIGSPHANRNHYQTRGLIGFFINTLVNRVLLEKEQSFIALIQRVHQDQVNAQAHQDFPFDQLLDHLAIERDLSRSPLFQVMFGVQSFGHKEVSTISKYLKPTSLEKSSQIERFDLSIFMDDSNPKIAVQINYATSLFKDDTIERMARNYLVLLEKLTTNIAAPYLAHSLLDASSYQTMVYDWNATEVEYAKEETIVSLFELQVEKTPNQIAVVYEGEQLSYLELNEKSNQLALKIIKRYKNDIGAPLQADELIALCLDKSLEMVIGILGVLKAGAAYVPIDPEFPKDRIDFILEDTRATFVLTQEKIAQNQLSYLEKDQLVLIDLKQSFYKKDSIKNLGITIQSKDLSYVIYTSGTTGRPKGVMIQHDNLNQFIRTQSPYYSISHGKKVLQNASLVFDVSIWEILITLTVGAELHIVSTSRRQDGAELSNYIKEFDIDMAGLPPVFLKSFSANTLNSFLPILATGGESCPIEVMEDWSRNRRFIHTYGPTECTVSATMHEFKKGDLATNIGKPNANTKVYVLDSFQNPVPVGIIGELHIGGAGVAKGYLNRKELTEERFIENPFATDLDKEKGHSRMYKTGDLVRWLADGHLEYIGRNDDQVKIRGHRIELSEIESALSDIENIEQSCLLVKERHTNIGLSKYLVGYYVPSKSNYLKTSQELTEALSSVLPDYMIPSAFVGMEEFPVTVNGKLDKKALPNPEFNNEDNYVAPETELEESLCAIWASVLGLEQVGITDHFFRIGGNSILAMQLVHKMNQVFNSNIKIQAIFQYSTIKEIKTLLKDGNEIQVASGLVKISSKKSTKGHKKIFCAPGAGGNIVSFYELARELIESHTVYGFQAYGLDAHSEILETIPLIASQNILDMQKEDSKGPYHLAGYSLGAQVVYEMAMQLQENGFEVTALYIFDGQPFSPNSVSEKITRSYSEFLLGIVKVFLEYNGKNNVSMLKDKDLEGLSESEQLKLSYEVLIKNDIKWMSKADFTRFVSVYIQQGNSSTQYAPNYMDKLNCNVHVFRTNTDSIPISKDNLWQSVCNNEVSIHDAQGEHTTMLNLPYIKSITDIILKRKELNVL